MKNTPIHHLLRWALPMALAIGVGCLFFSFINTPPVDSKEITISMGTKVIVVGTDNWSIKKELESKEIVDLAYSNNGRYLVFGDCFNNNVVKLDANSYTQVEIPLESDRCPVKVDYDPDNQHIAASVIGRGLYLLGPNPEHEATLADAVDIQYRPDGKEIAIATKKELQIWTVSPFALRAKDDYELNCLAYTPDGERLFMGSRFGWLVQELKAGAGKELKKTMGEPTVDIAIDPKGRWAAIVSDHKVEIFDVKLLRLVTQFYFPADTHLKGVAFSDHGGWLAVAEHQDNIHIYATSSWKEIKTLPITGHYWGMEFKPVVIAPVKPDYSAVIVSMMRSPMNMYPGSEIKKGLVVSLKQAMPDLTKETVTVDLVLRSKKTYPVPAPLAYPSEKYKDGMLLNNGRYEVNITGGMVNLKLKSGMVIPGDTPEGTYYVLAVADAGNKHPESNERNNVAYLEIKVKKRVDDRPVN
jgi:hypothetical protein